jgi:peroxiredoxin
MLKPDQTVPELTLPLTNGSTFDLSGQSPENFTMLLFYRGKHCPICKGQLKTLAGKLDKFSERGVKTVAISMDDEDRARTVHEEWETGDVPLAYGLSEDQAREWGLYISQKLEGSDEPEVFSEPGLFLVRPDGTLYFASVQNVPFTRPPLDELLMGIDYAVNKGYPARGTLT